MITDPLEWQNLKAMVSQLVVLATQLADLQELLYAEHKQKVLIVLQGMDTSGKDSTIRHVFGDVNPQHQCLWFQSAYPAGIGS